MLISVVPGSFVIHPVLTGYQVTKGKITRAKNLLHPGPGSDHSSMEHPARQLGSLTSSGSMGAVQDRAAQSLLANCRQVGFWAPPPTVRTRCTAGAPRACNRAQPWASWRHSSNPCRNRASPTGRGSRQGIGSESSTGAAGTGDLWDGGDQADG